jgi:hypothetical protein
MQFATAVAIIYEMITSSSTTGDSKMIYEKFDHKTECAAYREDVATQREADRIAAIEADRFNWAQRNGNDSGFDPYAGCEGEFDA